MFFVTTIVFHNHLPLLFVSLKPAIPSALPMLASFSLSAHLLASSCNSDPHWGFQSPALLWNRDSLALPHPSEPSAPPRSIDQSALPWLLASSAPPGTVIYSVPPGSLFPPAPPCSVVTPPLPWTSGLSAVLHPCTPTATSGSSNASGSTTHWCCLNPPAPWLHLGRCRWNFTLDSWSIDVAWSLGHSDFARFHRGSSLHQFCCESPSS